MYRYYIFLIAFLISSLVNATTNTATIELRRSIHSSKQKPFDYDYTFMGIIKYILFKLRILPFEFSDYFGLLNEKEEVPNYIQVIYTFIFSFLVSFFVYNLFLLTMGYKTLWLFWFGNFNYDKKYIKREKNK